jgi:hypothetical protein
MAEAVSSDDAAIIAAVEAGTDTIAVPAPLVEEAPEAAPELARALHAQIATMSVSQKIKLALRGNKDARQILVRENNKLIRRLVLQNPRIGDGEILAITHNRTADEELLRVISDRREWMRNYQVRLGLATNPKTPIAVALKQLSVLGERDIRALAKSRNIPQAVAVQARRILAARNPGGA